MTFNEKSTKNRNFLIKHMGIFVNTVRCDYYGNIRIFQEEKFKQIIEIMPIRLTLCQPDRHGSFLLIGK